MIRLASGRRLTRVICAIFLALLSWAREHAHNTVISIRRFVRKEFQMDVGMRKLMELFYRGVRERGPDPIPAAESRRIARSMDAIFAQMPKVGD
jgi:hypothetical protein